jgi:heptosyltransferase II
MKKICVVRLGGFGDILITTPTIRAIAAHYNTTAIDYIVAPNNADALTGTPYIRTVIPFNKRTDTTLATFPAFLKQLKAARYDLFLNFQPSVKTELMALASGASQRIRFRKDQALQPATGKMLHAIDDFGKEVLRLGITVTDRQMDFVIPDDARVSAARLLTEHQLLPDQPFVAVNPGASHSVNRWPAAQFAGLFQQLAQKLPHVGCVLLGGPDDRALAEQIATLAGMPVANLAGKMRFKELGAVLERASVLVTGDTGPQHIAAAVGTPLVSLFGPADPDRTGPIDVPALVVFNDSLDCVPCRSRTCRRGDLACMNQLSVERVLDAIERRMR